MPKRGRTCTSTSTTTSSFASRSFARTFALAAVLVLAAAPAEAQPDVPVGDLRLAALATTYFAAYWRLEPVAATHAGLHDYDDALGSSAADAYAARLALARTTLEDVKAIDPGTMGADASYDAQILAGRVAATVVRLGTLETWRHDPGAYAREASDAVLSLLARDFAPLPVRVRALVARERRIPEMLHDAVANITTVDDVTAGIARDDIAAALRVFDTAVPAGVMPLHDATLRAQFATSNRAAIAALGAYASALEAGPLAHPSGTFAIGPDRYAELLRDRELEPIPLAAYETAGEAALALTHADVVATAKRIDPAKAARDVVQALGARHPDASEVLGTAVNDLAALRSFVADHRLLTLPPDDEIAVVATPAVMQDATTVSVAAPGPLETHETHASLYVTPADPAWPPERAERYLRSYDDAVFPLILASEAIPGRYAAIALDEQAHLSPIRALMPSDSFARGWPHYVEQMLVDEGFGNGDPRVRLAQLERALQRECRLLTGLRLHTRGMTVEQAAAFFEQNAFLDSEAAEREALHAAADPFSGGDTLGKLEILKLREDYKRVMGSRYRLETFHDALLAHGAPPLAIARKLVLGADDDGKLL